MATLTIHHYLGVIDSFIKNIVDSRESYYMFIGRPQPWVDSNGDPNDSAVPIANGSVYQHESSIYNDMIFGKLLTGQDVKFMTRRIDWVEGNVYDAYDQDDGQLWYDKNYYVVNDDFEVYKCLFNNDGAPSTVRPSLVTSGTFSTADGYIWKYMYTVEPNANTRFTTTNFIPVTPNTVVESSAVGGTIDAIKVTDSGSNYRAYYSGYLTSVLTSNGQFNSYVVGIDRNASPLNNFYTGSAMYLNAGFGAGQVREIRKYDGPNRLVTLDNPFTSYVTFNFSDITGSFNIGDTLTQNVDSVAFVFRTGVFQSGDSVIQSDTGATGTISTANSSVLRILRNSGSSLFQLNYPIVNASDAGTIQTGTVNVANSSNVVSANSGTAFTSEYAVGDYIRVGPVANSNVRRITSVNSTALVVSQNFENTLSGATHYKIPHAAISDSVTIISANGYVSNVNLNGVKLTISDPSILGQTFFIGEKVNMVDVSNTNQSVYGIVSYANNTNLILTDVVGTFIGGNTFYVRGDSTLQRNKINNVDSYPNLTIRDPIGNFLIGQPVTCRDSSSLAVVGSANVVSFSIVPNELTEYIISPKVTIDGDGQGARAYTEINSANNANSISRVVVIDPGIGYTQANVFITSNNTHGAGAEALPVVAPANGHGSNTYAELGARYAGISVIFDEPENESYKFPQYGKYRRIGIIENILFDDITVDLDTFDRSTLTLTDTFGDGFEVGEYVLQPNTNAVGIISFANNTDMEVKLVKGEFVANSQYANTYPANDNIIGLTTGTTANVSTANINYFRILSDVEVVTELRTFASAQLVALNSNTQVKLTNVQGDFAANDTMYSLTTNTYANVVSLYSSNGTIEVTSSFAQKFNQTLRFPMTSNTDAFSQFELVEQEITGAVGRIISNDNEYDIKIEDASGSFSVGNIIENQNTNSNAVVIFANSSYLRLTSASGPFYQYDSIVNNLGVTANVANVFPCLVLSDIQTNESARFQTGPLSGNVVGLDSGAIGKCSMQNVIVFPDLVRDSGTVIYMENMAPFELSNNSREDIKVIIKF